MSDHYAGLVRASSALPGIEFAETSYRGDQTVPRHVHERTLVAMVMAGAMQEHARGRRVNCLPGTAILHPAGEAHAHRFGAGGSRCLVLQFDGSWLRRLGVEPNVIPRGPTTRLDEDVTTAGRLLHRELRRGDAAHPAALEGLALVLVASVTRTRDAGPERRPDFLDRVVQRLHDDLSCDTDLSSLAEIAGVSPEHLARSFQKEKNCTIGEYVRRLRVRRARRVLTESDLPLSRLALDLGFYDQSHFTRTFKAHVGCPPGEYRRRTRGSKDRER